MSFTNATRILRNSEARLANSADGIYDENLVLLFWENIESKYIDECIRYLNDSSQRVIYTPSSGTTQFYDVSFNEDLYHLHAYYSASDERIYRVLMKSAVTTSAYTQSGTKWRLLAGETWESGTSNLSLVMYNVDPDSIVSLESESIPETITDAIYLLGGTQLSGTWFNLKRESQFNADTGLYDLKWFVAKYASKEYLFIDDTNKFQDTLRFFKFKMTKDAIEDFENNYYFVSTTKKYYYSTNGTTYTKENGELATGTLPAIAKNIVTYEKGRSIQYTSNPDRDTGEVDIQVVLTYSENTHINLSGSKAPNVDVDIVENTHAPFQATVGSPTANQTIEVTNRVNPDGTFDTRKVTTTQQTTTGDDFQKLKTYTQETTIVDNATAALGDPGSAEFGKVKTSESIPLPNGLFRTINTVRTNIYESQLNASQNKEANTAELVQITYHDSEQKFAADGGSITDRSQGEIKSLTNERLEDGKYRTTVRTITNSNVNIKAQDIAVGNGNGYTETTTVNTSNTNKTSIQNADKAHNKIVTVENTPNDDGTFRTSKTIRTIAAPVGNGGTTTPNFSETVEITNNATATLSAPTNNTAGTTVKHESIPLENGLFRTIKTTTNPGELITNEEQENKFFAETVEIKTYTTDAAPTPTREDGKVKELIVEELQDGSTKQTLITRTFTGFSNQENAVENAQESLLTVTTYESTEQKFVSDGGSITDPDAGEEKVIENQPQDSGNFITKVTTRTSKNQSSTSQVKYGQEPHFALDGYNDFIYFNTNSNQWIKEQKVGTVYIDFAFPDDYEILPRANDTLNIDGDAFDFPYSSKEKAANLIFLCSTRIRSQDNDTPGPGDHEFFTGQTSDSLTGNEAYNKNHLAGSLLATLQRHESNGKFLLSFGMRLTEYWGGDISHTFYVPEGARRFRVAYSGNTLGPHPLETNIPVKMAVQYADSNNSNPTFTTAAKVFENGLGSKDGTQVHGVTTSDQYAGMSYLRNAHDYFFPVVIGAGSYGGDGQFEGGSTTNENFSIRSEKFNLFSFAYANAAANDEDLENWCNNGDLPSRGVTFNLDPSKGSYIDYQNKILDVAPKNPMVTASTVTAGDYYRIDSPLQNTSSYNTWVGTDTIDAGWDKLPLRPTITFPWSETYIPSPSAGSHIGVSLRHKRYISSASRSGDVLTINLTDDHPFTSSMSYPHTWQGEKSNGVVGHRNLAKIQVMGLHGDVDPNNAYWRVRDEEIKFISDTQITIKMEHHHPNAYTGSETYDLFQYRDYINYNESVHNFIFKRAVQGSWFRSAKTGSINSSAEVSSVYQPSTTLIFSPEVVGDMDILSGISSVSTVINTNNTQQKFISEGGSIADPKAGETKEIQNEILSNGNYRTTITTTKTNANSTVDINKDFFKTETIVKQINSPIPIQAPALEQNKTHKVINEVNSDGTFNSSIQTTTAIERTWEEIERVGDTTASTGEGGQETVSTITVNSTSPLSSSDVSNDNNTNTSITNVQNPDGTYNTIKRVTTFKHQEASGKTRSGPSGYNEETTITVNNDEEVSFLNGDVPVGETWTIENTPQGDGRYRTTLRKIKPINREGTSTSRIGKGSTTEGYDEGQLIQTTTQTAASTEASASGPSEGFVTSVENTPNNDGTFTTSVTERTIYGSRHSSAYRSNIDRFVNDISLNDLKRTDLESLLQGKLMYDEYANIYEMAAIDGATGDDDIVSINFDINYTTDATTSTSLVNGYKTYAPEIPGSGTVKRDASRLYYLYEYKAGINLNINTSYNRETDTYSARIAIEKSNLQWHISTFDNRSDEISSIIHIENATVEEKDEWLLQHYFDKNLVLYESKDSEFISKMGYPTPKAIPSSVTIDNADAAYTDGTLNYDSLDEDSGRPVYKLATQTISFNMDKSRWEHTVGLNVIHWCNSLEGTPPTDLTWAAGSTSTSTYATVTHSGTETVNIPSAAKRLHEFVAGRTVRYQSFYDEMDKNYNFTIEVTQIKKSTQDGTTRFSITTSNWVDSTSHTYTQNGYLNGKPVYLADTGNYFIGWYKDKWIVADSVAAFSISVDPDSDIKAFSYKSAVGEPRAPSYTNADWKLSSNGNQPSGSISLSYDTTNSNSILSYKGSPNAETEIVEEFGLTKDELIERQNRFKINNYGSGNNVQFQSTKSVSGLYSYKATLLHKAKTINHVVVGHKIYYFGENSPLPPSTKPDADPNKFYVIPVKSELAEVQADVRYNAANDTYQWTIVENMEKDNYNYITQWGAGVGMIPHKSLPWVNKAPLLTDGTFDRRREMWVYKNVPYLPRNIDWGDDMFKESKWQPGTQEGLMDDTFVTSRGRNVRYSAEATHNIDIRSTFKEVEVGDVTRKLLRINDTDNNEAGFYSVWRKATHDLSNSGYTYTYIKTFGHNQNLAPSGETDDFGNDVQYLVDVTDYTNLDHKSDEHTWIPADFRVTAHNNALGLRSGENITANLDNLDPDNLDETLDDVYEVHEDWWYEQGGVCTTGTYAYQRYYTLKYNVTVNRNNTYNIEKERITHTVPTVYGLYGDGDTHIPVAAEGQDENTYAVIDAINGYFITGTIVNWEVQNSSLRTFLAAPDGGAWMRYVQSVVTETAASIPTEQQIYPRGYNSRRTAGTQFGDAWNDVFAEISAKAAANDTLGEGNEIHTYEGDTSLDGVDLSTIDTSALETDDNHSTNTPNLLMWNLQSSRARQVLTTQTRKYFCIPPPQSHWRCPNYDQTPVGGTMPTSGEDMAQHEMTEQLNRLGAYLWSVTKSHVVYGDWVVCYRDALLHTQMSMRFCYWAEQQGLPNFPGGTAYAPATSSLLHDSTGVYSEIY